MFYEIFFLLVPERLYSMYDVFMRKRSNESEVERETKRERLRACVRACVWGSEKERKKERERACASDGMHACVFARMRVRARVYA